ncbi:MBL fold metallo-hydrolase [Streptomyces sp. 5-6(2022)]|uniref:MBL fold metallo-hydrolase n=1 Tax=Streptomyces sp. 5-6(2022) TaxID=2936510 RepID=UPI0023BA0D47|nr:MBL fold metallo-hydrolase [Streptomyces sp. 5-6(2022)]
MTAKRASRFNRRLLIRGAAAGAAVPAVLPTTARAAAGTASRTPSSSKTSDATFQWLGTSGWRIDTDGRTILFDPFLSRFETGLFKQSFNPKTPLTTDGETIDRHMGRPELILVSHSHWDHLNDVPYIAAAAPDARIVGTETTYHLLRAFGVDKARIAVVKGGEALDFDGLVVEAVSSRHSRNDAYSYFVPGTLTSPPPRPQTVSDLPEGDTLAFHVTLPDGLSAFLMGASDFSERDAAGLRPDVAMVATPSTSATHRYAPRLLKALGHPATVVPVHWDNFELPLDEGAHRDSTMDLDGFLARIRETSPGSRILLPEYLTPYRF